MGHRREGRLPQIGDSTVHENRQQREAKDQMSHCY